MALLANITTTVDILSRYLRHYFHRTEILARTVAAPLDLELALGEALRPDQNLPGDTDQVGGRELRAGALVGIVIEHIDALGLKFAIELFAGAIDGRVALLQVQNHSGERRHGLRPFDACIVVAGVDDSADQTRDADAVGTAMDRHVDAIGAGDQRLHRIGIFGAEIEDLADLDAARIDALVGRHFALVTLGIVDVLGRSVDRRSLVYSAGEIALVIDIIRRDRQIEHVAVAEHAGFAGFRQHDEFMA